MTTNTFNRKYLKDSTLTKQFTTTFDKPKRKTLTSALAAAYKATNRDMGVTGVNHWLTNPGENAWEKAVRMREENHPLVHGGKALTQAKLMNRRSAYRNKEIKGESL